MSIDTILSYDKKRNYGTMKRFIAMDDISGYLLGIEPVSKIAAEIVGYIGVLIMLYGALRTAYMFWLHITLHRCELPAIRINLGKYLSLGLEFLIGKDIVESIIAPTWNELGMLGAIIILRSIITLFLRWELKEIESEMQFRQTEQRQSLQ